MSQYAFILLSGPSGVGKSTIKDKLLSLYGPKRATTLVSYTTRKPRDNEQNTRDYYFITENEFLILKKKGFFAEWSRVYNHYYGTSLEQLRANWEKNLMVIKDFDVVGVKLLKSKFPKALSFYIMPPVLKVLAQRVRNRKLSSHTDKAYRIEQAHAEIAESKNYDHCVVNEDLSDCVEKIKSTIDSCL